MTYPAATLRWSPRPAADYVRTVDGLQVGPGANRALTQEPGAWNVYWLSYPYLEAHTDLGVGRGPIFTDPLAQFAIATARAFVGSARVGDLAVHLLPDRFVAELRRRTQTVDLPLARTFGLEPWLDTMELRAGLALDGRTFDLTSQEDGTTAEESTNILPLVSLLGHRLH